MITRIHDDLARGLSSGQVLTDVSSIVKELLENSLDAQADSISILLDEYGLDRITCIDNGKGVSRLDCSLISLPYHTSKIESFDDITTVLSYGFRGQALASLAEICQSFELTTRTPQDSTATCWLKLESSPMKEVRTTGSPQGTTIIAKAPFYRLPVRRYHMRKKTTRLFSELKDMITKYHFMHPQARIRLVVKSSRKDEASNSFVWTKQQTLPAAIAAQFGKALTSSYHERRYELPYISLHAYIPSKSSGKVVQGHGQHFYVNKRPLSTSRGFGQSVIRIIRQQLQSLFPNPLQDFFMFLHLQCSPSMYDQNIEPAKDVLFFNDTNQGIVSEAILNMLKETYSEGECATGSVQTSSSTTSEPCRAVMQRSSSILSLRSMSAAETTVQRTSTSASNSCSFESVSSDVIVPDSSSPTRLQETEPEAWKTSMFDDFQDTEDAIIQRADPQDVTDRTESLMYETAVPESVEDYIPERPEMYKYAPETTLKNCI